MKKLFLLSAVLSVAAFFCSSTAAANDKEKVVTGTVTLLSPSNVLVLDQYMAEQQYLGGDALLGLNVKLGALYKKHDNLSWDLSYTSFGRPKLLDNKELWPTLTNPAKTQDLDYSPISLGYGTYYHWNIGKKLMIKAGGIFDIYGAMKSSTPDGVNNAANIEGQMMIKAHAAIKYGWDFKKWALDLRANLTLPVAGIITADHPYEPALSILGKSDHAVMYPAYNHIFVASYHNYMSLDYEFGIDFVLKPCTITVGFGSTTKKWNIYGIQNFRYISYSTIGVAFDIVSRDKFKSSNKNF